MGLVEAPSLVESNDVDRASVFGSINDALVGISLLLLVPIAVLLARPNGSGRGPQVFGVVGVSGLVVAAAIQFLHVLRAIDTTAQPILTGVAFVMVGVWLLALTYPAHAGVVFGVAARWAGALAGLGYLSIGGLAVAVGPAARAHPEKFLSSPFVVVVYADGLLRSQFGPPVWAILSGRRLLAAK